MNFNSKKGVSLVALLITILVFMILSTIIVLSAKNSTDNANLTDFISDLEKIEEATKNYYIQQGEYPALQDEESGTDVVYTQAEVLQMAGDAKRAYLREEMEENSDYSEDGSIDFYAIDLSKIGVSQSKRGTIKAGEPNDVYLASSATGRIYYLKGLETKDNTYFSISTKAVKIYAINDSILPKEEDIDVVVSVAFDKNYPSAVNDIQPKSIRYGSKYGNLTTPVRNSTVYTVSYDAGASDARLATLTDKNTKARVDYEFQGWYKEELFVNKVTSESVQNSTSDHTLYAKWKTKESSTVELPNVTRSNYVFDSWYDGEKRVGGIGEQYKVTKPSTMLIAHWKEMGYSLFVNPGQEEYGGIFGTVVSVIAPQSSYEIVYDALGGTCSKATEHANRNFSKWVLSGGGSINSDTANPVDYTFADSNATLTAYYNEYAEAVTLPDVTKDGYTFIGWYTEKEGGTKVGEAGQPYKAGSDVRLYAQYIKNAQYKVEHYLENANDDEYTLSKTTTYSGTIGWQVEAKAETFDGYVLDKSVVGTVESGAVTSDGNLKLKLYYKRERYSLTFTILGGAGNAYTPGMYKHGQTVQIVANPGVGVHFSNWSTTDDIVIENTLSATTTFKMPRSNVNITANFDSTDYVLIVEPGGSEYNGVFNEVKQIPAPDGPSYSVTLEYGYDGKVETLKSNRQFTEWTLTGGGTVENYTKNPAKYTFGSQNGVLTAHYSDIGQSIDLPVVNREGLTFNGWYSYITDDEGQKLEKISDGGQYTPTSDITLVALYTYDAYSLRVEPGGAEYQQQYNNKISIDVPSVNYYTVEFDANGGNFGVNIDSSTSEEIPILYTTRESYQIFDHWKLTGGGSINSDKANPVEYTFGTQDAILEAKFLDEYESVQLPKPQREEGYIFAGWYEDENFQRRAGDALDEYTPNSDITLYAKWDYENYKLTVKPGDIEYEGQYLSSVNVQIPTETAYTVTLVPGEGTLEQTTISANKEFTSWTLSGKGKISSQEEGWTFEFGASDSILTANYSDEIIPVNLPTPVLEGYSFDGWYLDEELENKLEEPYDKYVPTEDITLYAKYNKGVASIETTIFDTLQDAIDYVQDTPATITLLVDINPTETFIIDEGKDITLDVSDYSISSSADYVFSNSGTLKIIGNNKNKIKSTEGAIIKNTGTLDIDNIYLEGNTECIYNLNTLNIKNCEIISNNSHAIINESENANLTVTDSNIGNGYEFDDGNYSETILNKDGANLNIAKGEINANNRGAAILNINNSNLTLGNDDTQIENDLVRITGVSFGIKNEESTLHFFDGTIIGETAIDGGMQYTPAGYTIFVEKDSNSGLQTATLYEESSVILNLVAEEGGSVDGAGIYSPSSQVSITAIPEAGFAFMGWYEDDELVSPDSNYVFDMPDTPLKLTARFQATDVYIVDSDAPGYLISEDNTTLTCDSENTIYIDIPKDGYMINKLPSPENNYFTVYVKNDDEEDYVLVSEESETLPYITTQKCSVKLVGKGVININLFNSDNAYIYENMPECTVRFYSPTKENLYKTVNTVKWQDILSIMPDVPTRIGYTFNGWSVDSESKVGTMNMSITQDVDLYAIWEINNLYIESNFSDISILNNTINTNVTSKIYTRFTNKESIYSISGVLNDLAQLKYYSPNGWLNDSMLTLAKSGPDTLDNFKIDILNNMVVGITGSSSNISFKINEDTVPLLHAMDGYVSDGLVANYDGRYNTKNKEFDSSLDWYNIAKTGFRSNTNNLIRGYNYFTFNGTSSWANLMDTNTENITLEVVFSSNRESRSEPEYIIGNLTNNSGGAGIFIDTDGKIKGSVFIDGAFRTVESPELYATSQITKASLTYNSNILCLYINGDLVDSLSQEGNITIPDDKTPIILGARLNSQDEKDSYLSGDIYSALIYNQALSNSEINKNFEISKVHIYGL